MKNPLNRYTKAAAAPRKEVKAKKVTRTGKAPDVWVKVNGKWVKKN